MPQMRAANRSEDPARYGGDQSSAVLQKMQAVNRREYQEPVPSRLSRQPERVCGSGVFCFCSEVIARGSKADPTLRASGLLCADARYMVREAPTETQRYAFAGSNVMAKALQAGALDEAASPGTAHPRAVLPQLRPLGLARAGNGCRPHRSAPRQHGAVHCGKQFAVALPFLSCAQNRRRTPLNRSLKSGGSFVARTQMHLRTDVRRAVAHPRGLSGMPPILEKVFGVGWSTERGGIGRARMSPVGFRVRGKG